MKKYQNFLFLFGLIFCHFVASSSENDSILTLIGKSKQFYTTNLDSSLLLAKEAIRLSLNTNDFLLTGQAFSNLGVAFWYLAEFDSAKVQFEKAIPCFEKVNDSLRLAKTYANLGLLQNNSGDLNQAFTSFSESLKIFEDFKDTAAIINSNINIGLIYLDFDLFDYAQKSFESNLELIKNDSLNNRWIVTLNNLGLTFLKNKKYKEAVEYYEKALILADLQCDDFDAAQSHISLATVYGDLEDFDKAKSHYRQAIELNKKTDYLIGEYEAVLLFAMMYQNTGDFVQAEQLIKTVESEIKALDDFRLNMLLMKSNAVQEKWKSNYKRALELQIKQQNLSDSIINLETKQRVAFFSVLYETEKKDNQIEQLNLENRLKGKEIQSKQNRIFGILILSFLTGLAALFYFRSYKKKKESDFLTAQIASREELRGIISAEIHDKVCSDLVGFRFKIRQLASAENWQAKKDELEKTLENIYTDARNISKELKTPDWGKIEIYQFISEIANKTGLSQNLKIKYDIQSAQGWQNFKNEAKSELNLIIREVCVNIIKHAKAGNVQFLVRNKNGFLEVNIYDDGIGMQNKTTGGGLENIKKRMKKLNGVFYFENASGSGTIIHLNIPVA